LAIYFSTKVILKFGPRPCIIPFVFFESAAAAAGLIYIYFCTPSRAIKHSGWLIIEVLEFGGGRQML